jgi:uncharacterized lipoprotein YmbA
VVLRYFTPEYAAAPAVVPARPDLRLRLGHVEASAYLSERMAARRAGRELVYREDWRWTERPEIYLRRSLARALFEERGVTDSSSPRAIILDVELIAFEEIEEPHTGRLQALVVLRSDGLAVFEQTITVERPVRRDADEAAAVVDALSQALQAGVAQIADQVVARLTLQAAK